MQKHYVIDANAPMKSEFFLWLMAQPFEKLTGTSSKELRAEFLRVNGYESGDTEPMNYIITHSFNSWRLHNNHFNLSDLLTRCESGGFWVRGLQGRYELTRKLKELITSLDLVNSDIYFDVIRGNRLYVKYQTILGSRALCTITDLDEGN